MATTHLCGDSNNKSIMEDDEACSFAMAIATGATLPMVVNAMIELGVLEIIKRAGPGAHLSSTEIAAQLPANKNPEAATMLDRVLRLLASYSILSYSIRTHPDGRAERLYGLAPVCKYLTLNEDGVGFGAFSLMVHDKVNMESWYHLKDAILEGGDPFEKAYGVPVFDYIGTDPRFNMLFIKAMKNHATITMTRILENYKGFEGLSTLVDVGGNTGASLNMIIKKYPTIKGINFDLPHVIKEAPKYTGIEHVEGDMFVSVPTGDAIFMKSVCHDWSDEHCLKFLKNCYAALPDHGKVINCDFILPEMPETSHAAKMTYQSDVLLLNNPGGKERTEQDFKALAKEAGFEGFRVVCSAYDVKVIEFLKKN